MRNTIEQNLDKIDWSTIKKKSLITENEAITSVIMDSITDNGIITITIELENNYECSISSKGWNINNEKGESIKYTPFPNQVVTADDIHKVLDYLANKCYNNK